MMTIATAPHAVFIGDYLPAHDEVFDLAEAIAARCFELHDYVSRVRSPEQATLAVRELLTALATA